MRLSGAGLHRGSGERERGAADLSRPATLEQAIKDGARKSWVYATIGVERANGNGVDISDMFLTYRSSGGYQLRLGLIMLVPATAAMSKESVSLLNYHTTFPRAVYPTETYSECHTGRQYTLSSSSSSTTPAGSPATPKTTQTFNLGVYNLAPVAADEDCLAPVDPLCLSTLLSILSRESLKLPRRAAEVTAERGNSSNFNSISVLSLHAAIDDQLPILVEDAKDRVSHRVVRKIHYSRVINVLNSSKLSPQDELVYTLINTQLFDFYNLAVLQLDDETLLRFYSLSQYNFSAPLQSFPPLTKFLATDVRLSLLKRNDFHLRNPDTFAYFSSYFIPKSARLAYRSESDRIIRNASSLLSLFNQSLLRTKYWSSDESIPTAPGVIDFQLAGLLYSMKYLSAFTLVFNDLLSENNVLVSHSNDIIVSFI